MMETELEGMAAAAAAEPETTDTPASTTLVPADPQQMTPEEQERISEVAAKVDEVVQAADAIQVRNAEEAQAATEFLSQLAAQKRQSESARKFLVQPLNDHVKRINAEFKPKTEALAEADQTVRRKVLAYNAEQEQARAAEQARLDAERREREEAAAEERRKAEAAAAAAREAAAREAAKAEAARRKAEEEAARADREAATKLEREMRDMSEVGLDAELRLSRNAKRREAAQQELDRREAIAAAEEARKREEQAQAAELAAREAELEAHNTPPADVPEVLVADGGPLRAPSGSASTRKSWQFEIEDASKLPAEYLIPNEKAIRAAIGHGERHIPGVRIFQATGLAVRAR